MLSRAALSGNSSLYPSYHTWYLCAHNSNLKIKGMTIRDWSRLPSPWTSKHTSEGRNCHLQATCSSIERVLEMGLLTRCEEDCALWQLRYSIMWSNSSHHTDMNMIKGLLGQAVRFKKRDKKLLNLQRFSAGQLCVSSKA